MISCKTAYLKAFACVVIAMFLGAQSVSSAPQTPGVSEEPTINYLFRDSFYASPRLKLKYDIYESAGFLLVRSSKRGRNSEFSVVTDFSDPILEGHVLTDIRSIEAANTFLERNVRKIFFERIPIKELALLAPDGDVSSRYWVGQRSYATLQKAKENIVQTKSIIDIGGGDFNRAVELVTEFFPEEPGPTAEEVRANFLEEEELALKIFDWLDIGEKQYGILTGTPWSEKILWQAFGESSYRYTNIDKPNFESQVGFWSNRLVFKGLKFFGETTLDPYVEMTAALESNGNNAATHLDMAAGIEYRPFNRNAYLENYNIDGLYVLRFFKNWRFFVEYAERKNITDEIIGARDTDLLFGADVFYEWGLDLEEPWIKKVRTKFTDYIHDFVWGEYFGDYRFERSNFSSVDSFNSWIMTSSVILGVKWPDIALPRNPINDRLLLMPYMRFEHTTNPHRSDLFFQNQIYVAAGVRWMPFRSYQFQNNEWLFLTKFFAEYIGVGKLHNPGSAVGHGGTRRDWWIGVKASHKRF